MINTNPKSETKKTKTTTKKTAPKETVEEIVQEVVETPVASVNAFGFSEAEIAAILKQFADMKAAEKITPDTIVTVQSNFAGLLTYTSKKTNETIDWPSLGMTNPMTVEELTTMRNTQRGFFKNKWIKFVSDNAADVIKYLRVEEYFENFVDLTNLDELFKQKLEDIVAQVEAMPEEAKTALAIAAKRMIEDGDLRDIIVVRELGKAIGYDLFQA